MKSVTRILCMAFTVSLVFYSLPLEANHQNPHDLETVALLKRAKWVGVWDYTVEDVPPEYSKGVLHVTKKKRVHIVKIELESGTLDAEQVVVKKKQLNFSLNIEGQQVDVSLVMDGDSFSGESSSPDGVFALQGTRRK
ncbi:MAG: hypothetical protein AB3N14_19420 [Flavobacteriaceae bacterium]